MEGTHGDFRARKFPASFADDLGIEYIYIYILYFLYHFL
jgi:hypothetical protein